MTALVASSEFHPDGVGDRNRRAEVQRPLATVVITGGILSPTALTFAGAAAAFIGW